MDRRRTAGTVAKSHRNERAMSLDPKPIVFTEVLDRVMVGWNEPLAYRHHREWGNMLTELGFKVRMVRVPDVLPYPHVVIAATKV